MINLLCHYPIFFIFINYTLAICTFLQILDDNSGLTLSNINVIITRWHQLALVYSLQVNWLSSVWILGVRVSSNYGTISDAMNQTDEESETLHRQLLDREIDLAAFVQKYKKLRYTYHKRALTHLAAKTSATSWITVCSWKLYFLLVVNCCETLVLGYFCVFS